MTIRVLYLQPGLGIGGSKVSLYHLVVEHPEALVCQLALSYPADEMFLSLEGQQVEKVHELYLPIWKKQPERGQIKKLLAFFLRVRRGGWVGATLRLCKIILENHIDLVHTNNAMCPVGAFAARLCRRPHLWHIRELIGTGSQYPLLISNARAANLIGKLSSTVVCNSQYTAQFSPAHNIPTEVVYNGLKLETFAACKEKGAALRQELSLPEMGVVVGMVGNLGSEVKNHGLFLEAMALVRTAFPNVWFVVFGSETNLQKAFIRVVAQKAQQLGLASRLIWAGHVEDVPAIMGSLDILVHPVSNEGSGRVVMEAMAAGKPVVGIGAGGVQELVRDGETGFLVSPHPMADAAHQMADAAHQMADAANKLLLDEALRAKMGLFAQKIAFEQFSHEHTQTAILNLYKKIL